MTRIYVLAEGQTEEAFVNELLQPHYSRVGLYLTPIIVSTRPGYRGGIINYGKIKPQIDRLCKQDRNAYVTTIFDLYGWPEDAPGKANSSYSQQTNGRQKADFLEEALAQDIPYSNFIPNLLVHEFEALLFAQVDVFEEWMDKSGNLHILHNIRKEHAPEDINDHPDSAPSKRILNAMPYYDKTVHGPLIACTIGLAAIRAACPHFDGWLKKLELLHQQLT